MKWIISVFGFVLTITATITATAGTVKLESLLQEMTNREALARFPEPAYRQLQASSYNRASVARGQPGWFADQDGVSFIRTDTTGDRQEWVLMEHRGPGCITRMWTPYFYYGMGNRTGPNLRIYLDGQEHPVVDENMIALLTGRVKWADPPFAAETARAGMFFLPIPFAHHCRITTTQKPFYNIINYRAYPDGTRVETFSPPVLTRLNAQVRQTAKILVQPPPTATPRHQQSATLPPGEILALALREPGQAIRTLSFQVPGAPADSLRSLVLSAAFDGEETVWCPVGDLFSAADRVHPLQMWSREVDASETLTCRWIMPYRDHADIVLHNLGTRPITVQLNCDTQAWTWDKRSMYFHANWHYESPEPVLPLRDWNFIDIEGQGVLVGDSWSVLVPHQGWWGEGDEKIYVDLPPQAPFPTHFGTGTEDYYGWAGGVVPTPADEFSHPFAANVRVGGGAPNGRTRGYNICARSRVLDAIPFEQRLQFDMEASSLERKPDLYQHYSGVTFWYARPGARHNRPPQPEDAARPLLTAQDLDALAIERKQVTTLPGAIEFETFKASAHSPGMKMGPQRPHASFLPAQWSGEEHLFMQPQAPGDFVEFTLSEQFAPRRLKLYLTYSFDFGVMKISVNGRVVQKSLDLFHERPTVYPLDLGVVAPVDNAYVLRFEYVAPGPRSRGTRSFLGLDCVVLSAP